MSGTALLELLERDELVVLPGVFDGLTATIVEDLGYEAIYQGGYATGASTAITEPIISAPEMCDRAREITESVDVPLLVDGNAGFGDPAHTYRSVNAYVNAGISGIHIEDQVHPKRLHYHAGIKRIIGVDEMLDKVEAAVQARQDHDHDIAIVARSDAARDQRREDERIEDAVERVNQYLNAGADAAMVFPSTEAELRYAANHIDGPFIFTLVEGREPRPSTDELDEIGVSAVLYAISATVAAGQRIHDLYSTLQETGETGLDMEAFNQTQSMVEDRIGLPKYYDIEERTGKK